MSDNISNSNTNLSTNETMCCCSIECQNCTKMEQTINSLKEKNVELLYELEQFRCKETEKLARFVLIPNKVTDVDNHEISTCCENKCINNNLKYGSCVSKNGYVNIRDDGKIQYFLAKENGKNNWICMSAQNTFNRKDCYSKRYSLFYYEIKMIKETDKQCYVGIGFNNEAARIFLCNGTSTWSGYQKFSWEDGDVFGCGAVFQPKKESYTIVFFTKNGQKIGNPVFLEEIGILRPVIGVKECSVETNFGYDLATKPFIYYVNKHFC